MDKDSIISNKEIVNIHTCDLILLFYQVIGKHNYLMKDPNDRISLTGNKRDRMIEYVVHLTVYAFQLLIILTMRFMINS